MRRRRIVYGFGAFELDPAGRRLVRDRQPVALRDSECAVLVELVRRWPDVVSRDDLAKAGWGGAASDNSIEQVIFRLRKALGQCGDTIYIETVPGRGYRFVPRVEPLDGHDTAGPHGLDAAPFRAFVQGRRELATLNRDAIQDARRAFETTIQHAPEYAAAHVGLANACALAFEATRFDAVCDLEALTRALDHARQGTTLDPASADAWSTLGFALYLNGDTDAAAEAAWRAVALEPGGWRHAVRLAYVSWGEERIEAAQSALTLRPGLALAHWLKATVLTARGAFDAALLELRAGCAAQDKQPPDAAAYPAVGLHLLHGLVLAAHGRVGEARREFSAELSAPDRGQLYSRECAANTCYALGAVCLRQGDAAAADAAFRRALEIAPGHLFSMAALGRPLPAMAADDPRLVDAAIARAIALTRAGRHRDAAQAYGEAVASAPAPNAGWILPVEPILDPGARPEIWSALLTRIQQRAT